MREKNRQAVREDEVPIGQAAFPKPFANGLEFNAPVHGTWNIVHIGLQMPEAVQIYVCAKNCMRGVILTAAEMHASDRFSFVILEEEDMVSRCIDDVTIAGVADVIEKRTAVGQRPKAVQLFTVCVHHFLGTDYKRIYESLERQFPDIDFYRCYMDPIMQKKGPTPDQKLRRAMLEHFAPGPANAKAVAILGSDFALDETCEMAHLIRENGFELWQTRTCQSYEEYRKMGEAFLFIAVNPNARDGVRRAAERLGREFLYLPQAFGEEEIKEELNALRRVLQKEKFGESRDLEGDLLENQLSGGREPAPGVRVEFKYTSLTQLKEIEKQALTELKRYLGQTPISLDGIVHPRPLGIAHYLLANGFCVEKIYLDAISPEEEADFEWLRENHPDLVLSATIHVKKRRLKEGQKRLAVGPKAAYFDQTPHFVNMVSGFGLWGLDGRVRLLLKLKEAFLQEKDLKDIVPRKGLGCEGGCL